MNRHSDGSKSIVAVGHVISQRNARKSGRRLKKRPRALFREMRKQMRERGAYEIEEGLHLTGEPVARLLAEARTQARREKSPGDEPGAGKAPA